MGLVSRGQERTQAKDLAPRIWSVFLFLWSDRIVDVEMLKSAKTCIKQ